MSRWCGTDPSCVWEGGLGGIVCYAVFISVLPFSEIMLRTYWRLMPWRTINCFKWLPAMRIIKKKRRRVACTFTLPARSDVSISAQKQEKKNKKCIAKLTEIALNRFSIFTVYNICNVIYIYSQLLFIHFCASSIAFTHNTDWKSIPCRKHCQ